MKSGTRSHEVTRESFYKTGNLFRISHVQPADDGYLICAQVVQRVKDSLALRKRRAVLCQYTSRSRILQDLEEDLQVRIIADIKSTIHEISNRFQGSEQFTKPIDRMESVDQIMGFVMPFLPSSLAEKQALLEIVSVRQRYITFLEILIRAKENINFRIEMARKVSDKVSKSNREAMLREQLRVIQEELNESEGGGPGDAGYRERIEAAKMPDEVRKKALSELKKLEPGAARIMKVR